RPLSCTPFPYTTLFRSGDAADLAALQDDPQSIVLNGGVLDLSDFSTWQSGTSYNDGLEVSGSSGTVIGSQDVVDLAGGNDMHIGDRKSTRLNSSHVSIS